MSLNFRTVPLPSEGEDFSEEKEIFLRYIQQYGLRRTIQRDLILEIFLRTEEHLSSEDLYNIVKKEDPTIGQTTVYRTLKLLTESGLAREVRFGDGITHYEHHYNHEHHDHLVCVVCGKIIEFHAGQIKTLQNEIAAEHGFEPTQYRLQIWGNCAECVSQKTDDSKTGKTPRVRAA